MQAVPMPVAGLPQGQPFITFDKHGRPLLVFRKQATKRRLKGLEAQMANIRAAVAVSKLMRTSLGPRGFDKIIVSPDNDITITNDGASILESIPVDNRIAKLVVNLSKSQDEEFGDGTTGVVVLAGALLARLEKLIGQNLHPTLLCKGLEVARNFIVKHINNISETVHVSKENREFLMKAAKTSLSSKIASKAKDKIANVAVSAVCEVVDWNRNDLRFDLIKIHEHTGARLEDTEFMHGIVIEKGLSHHQMDTTMQNPKIALITFALEPQRPKTKYNMQIETGAAYHELHQVEQSYFTDIIKRFKDAGVDLVMCQWGFDDEANHLLYQNGLKAVRWVSGQDMELLAIALNASIIARPEDIIKERLGTCGVVREVRMGTELNTMLFLESCPNSSAVTILARGATDMTVAEVKRSIHDAICCTRNLIKSSRVVYGGGACEISSSVALADKATQLVGYDKLIFEALSEAFEDIPHALAENAGFSGTQTVVDLLAKQRKNKNHNLGVNCDNIAINDMKKLGVFESTLAKIGQINMAIELAKVVLKIDEVIDSTENF